MKDTLAMELEKQRTLHFNAPGFRSQEIIIAPDIDPIKSKRKPLIDEEDVYLDSNITELDSGTRARNRAFQERLDEIWRSAHTWEAKLRIEAQEAVETILNMKEEYQKHVDDFSFSIKAQINAIYDKIDNETIPAEVRRIDVIEKDLDFFIKETVPTTIEKQSGEVSRQLRRAYETFDIEKKKEEKRETKLINRAGKHMQKTAQRFEDEDAFLSSAFFNLEDDIIEHERRAARMHLLRNDKAIENIVQLKDISKSESESRQHEDVIVLDTVIDTQNTLQSMVLMHFGTKAEEMDFSDLPELDKLNDRMAKIEGKRTQRK